MWVLYAVGCAVGGRFAVVVWCLGHLAVGLCGDFYGIWAIGVVVSGVSGWF